jgi:hypothetical protein
VRTARRSIGKLSGQQPKTIATPVDNDHFIDAGMRSRSTGMFGIVLIVMLMIYISGYFVFSTRCQISNTTEARSFTKPWDRIYRPLAWVESQVRDNFIILSPVPLPDRPA